MIKRTPLVRALLLLPLLALLAASLPGVASSQPTGASKVYLPVVGKPFNFGTVTPNPVSVRISTDSTPVTATVDAETGGTLTATGSNGATYKLEIPADALLLDTTITMKPIRSVSGLPYGGQFRAGVQLTATVARPGGGQVPVEELRFYQLARLTMTAPVAVAPARQWAWASQSGGQHLYSYPLALGTPAIQFHLAHFSEYIYSEVDPILVVEPKPMPGPTEAQLVQAIAELLREERRRQLEGEPGDPGIWSKLEALLRAYYDVAIAPVLPIAEKNCREVEPIMGKAVGWVRQVELLSLGDELAPQVTKILASHRAAIENCWKEITEPCLNQSNQGEMARAFAVARAAQLLGMDANRFDPFNTTPCDCTGVARVTSGWTVNVSYNWSQSVTGPATGGLRGTESASALHAANVTAKLNTTEDPTSGHWKGLVSGSAELRDRTEYRADNGYYSWSEMTGSGAPLTATANGPIEAWVSFNGEQCTYMLWVPTWLNIRHTDSGGGGQVSSSVASNFWVAVLPLRWTAKENSFVIQDTWSIELNSERERARLQINSSARSYIGWLNGATPRAEVTWRIAPAVPPPPAP